MFFSNFNNTIGLKLSIDDVKIQQEKVKHYSWVFPVILKIDNIFNFKDDSYILDAISTDNKDLNIIDMEPLLSFIQFFRKNFKKQKNTPYRAKKGKVSLFLPHDKELLEEIFTILEYSDNCGHIAHELLFNGGIMCSPFSTAKEIAQSIIFTHDHSIEKSNYNSNKRPLLFYGKNSNNEKDPINIISSQFLTYPEKQLPKTNYHILMHIYNNINIYLSIVDFIDKNKNNDTEYHDWLMSTNEKVHVTIKNTDSYTAALSLFSLGENWIPGDTNNINAIAFYWDCMDKKTKISFHSILGSLNSSDIHYFKNHQYKMIKMYINMRKIDDNNFSYLCHLFMKTKTRELEYFYSPEQIRTILEDRLEKNSIVNNGHTDKQQYIVNNVLKELIIEKKESDHTHISYYTLYDIKFSNDTMYRKLISITSIINLFKLSLTEMSTINTLDLVKIVLIVFEPGTYFSNNGIRTVLTRAFTLYDYFPEFNNYVFFLNGIGQIEHKPNTNKQQWEKLLKEVKELESIDLVSINMIIDILCLERNNDYNPPNYYAIFQ